MSRGLKLYYDFMSQPSRALYILLEANKIPYQRCPVALRKFEQKTPEYRANVNRFGKVPCIVEQDSDFRLAESVAIYRYLAREYRLSDQWYPLGDSIRQARIDEYLSWQHLNLRADVSLYFFYVWLNPLMGKEVDPDKADRLRQRLTQGLNFFEREMLRDGASGPTLTGGDTLTVADLSAACEIEQAKIAGYDPCLGRPRIAHWMATVRAHTNPHYDEAHRFVYMLAPDHIVTPQLPEAE
ncbi:glutathione transferase, theta class [Anopheles darlingi]|uniref:Glutathione transferase, theta class n=1 Tax=Anopheles darlingi TaxID=43151 RepID=W5JWL4_ANODA|nr:glutathione S-transferase theta-1-like [Anopheles darlingi]ETN68078.1 glutathione transferase, theta class [Anopheles darlingi]